MYFVRKGIIGALVAVIFAVALFISNDMGYDSGYTNGYDDGAYDGYDAGYDDGYDSGYESGKKSFSPFSGFSYKSGSSSAGNTTLPQQQTVYITKTGTKYHRSGCSYLKSSIPISLSEAKAEGYTACSRCNPP